MNNFLKNIFIDNWENDFIIDSLQGERVSYKNFFSLVTRCVLFLKQHDVKKGDIVCVVMHNSLDLVIFYFAVLLLNIIIVPIDPLKSKKDISKIIQVSGCKKVFCGGGEFRDNIDVISSSLDLLENVDFDVPYLVTFTSGSTGEPKGVMHSFRDLFLSSIAFNKKFGFNKSNVFYHNLPMTYMAGILNLIFLPFLCESRIVIGQRFNVANVLNFWKTPVAYSVNTFWFIPTILSLLLKLDRGVEGVEFCKKNNVICCVGTAPLNDKIKNAFEKKYNVKLYQSYGLSETLFVSTESPRFLHTENSVGKVLQGVKLAFAPDGEILVNTPWNFMGYIGLDISESLHSKRFSSGDMGLFDEEENLFITGRKKDLIIRGGININPIVIEKFLSQVGCFEQSICLGIEDDILGEKVVSFMPAKRAISQTEQKEINSKILHELGKDYCIDEFVFIKEIPKNINGKVDRIKLKRMYRV